MFTEMRVLRQSSEDDHLVICLLAFFEKYFGVWSEWSLKFSQVLELGMNFLTADDMSAILAVQLRKRLGFGMWAKLHLTSMHVEGKVHNACMSVKFLLYGYKLDDEIV